MRKITQEAVNAFNNNESIRLWNTRVDSSGMITELYLNENKIAEKVKFTEVIRITNAWWFTTTTKERLNWIPWVSIKQKAWVWYLTVKSRTGNGLLLNLYNMYLLIYDRNVWSDDFDDYESIETIEICKSLEEAERLANSIWIINFKIAKMVYEQKGDVFKKTIINY